MDGPRAAHDLLRAAESSCAELQHLLDTSQRDAGRKLDQASSWRRKALGLEQKLAAANAAVSSQAGKINKMDDSPSSQSMWNKEASMLETLLMRWHVADVAQLCYLALYKIKHENGKRCHLDLATLPDSKMCNEVKDIIHEARDRLIAEHMAMVFSAEKWNTFRLGCVISWNNLGWVRDLMKYNHNGVDKHGARARTHHLLAPNSKVKMPDVIPLAPMHALSDEILNGPLGNVSSDDRRGAEVKSFDAQMLDLLVSANDSTMGGMAMTGARGDAHWIALTYDGDKLMEDDTAVRASASLASCNRLHQSSHGTRTLAMWRHGSADPGLAEAWLTVKTRTVQLRKDLYRLYRDPQMRDADGAPTNIFVRFVITGDKPALMKLLGRRSFAHDCFSACCGCSEKEGELNDYTKYYKSHYGELSYEDRCALAFVALWVALEEEEPTD